MTPRHPATRSDACRVCGAFGQGDELVHASRYRPEWKRGWVCREHVETPTLYGSQLILPGMSAESSQVR
jgi:hypothetical protein